MDLWAVVAGLVAFGVSVLAAVLLVFVTYRFNTVLTRKLDEERLLLSGNRSVAVASWLFARMTRSLPEHDEILKDNLAVAIFFAFVMLGITLIVNEGLEDLSRSIIPWGESGILRIP